MWEVKRGSVPSPESLAATLAEVERLLDDIGKVEVAIAEMRRALVSDSPTSERLGELVT